MNLKRRLERLAPGPSTAAHGARRSEGFDDTSGDLRREMRAFLERDPPSSGVRPARQRDGATLPFVRRQTSAGESWQRLEVLPDAHRVGRVAVADVARAEAAVLADLALDSSVAGSAPPGWLFLDLETTGLGGGGALAFLVGMAGLDASGSLVVEQLLLRDPAQEAALLERVLERVQAANLIISFNGKTFDRPLLEARCVMNRLPPLPPRPHLDLLHVGRRLHRRRLQSCSLGRLERDVLGFERGADVDGSEVPAMYTHFLRSADASALLPVVTHNFWDVVSMLALVALYGQRSPPLVAQDLAWLAFTLERAGATAHAERIADVACARGGGADALRVRAALSKSRGNTLGAVRDLEQLCKVTDDPSGRLELAKLYEHAMRSPARALQWVVQGTAEDADAHARRVSRLERKIRRNSMP